MCIVCWVHGTKTHEQTCFFVLKNLTGKITHGRGEQASKTWQKRKSSMIYKNLYRSKHLKQANTAIIFG